MITISIKTIWNPQQLLREAKRAKFATLRRGGAIVRGIMRNRLKYSKRAKSQPGQSPIAHTNPGIRGTIRFVMEQEQVIIGPQLTSKSSAASPIPGVLEHGGISKVRSFRSKRGMPKLPKSKPNYVRARIKPRPFAAPALATFAKQYPQIWRDAISK